MSTATHHSDAPATTRERHESLALAGGSHAELGSQAIHSHSDNQIYLKDLKTRTEMATPESKGFPPAHEVMHGMDTPVAVKSDKSSVADKGPSPSPDALLASAPVAAAEKAPEKAPTTEATVNTEHSTEAIGTRHLVSTVGADATITRGVDTTTYGSKTMDSIADSRPSNPIEQSQHQHHETQPQEPRLSPRTDIG